MGELEHSALKFVSLQACHTCTWPGAVAERSRRQHDAHVAGGGKVEIVYASRDAKGQLRDLAECTSRRGINEAIEGTEGGSNSGVNTGEPRHLLEGIESYYETIDCSQVSGLDGALF